MLVSKVPLDFMATLPSTDTSGHSPHRAENAGPDHISFARRDAAAIALLIACLVAMFWRVLFTPAMFFYRDVFNYSFPHAQFIHEVCRSGHLPYWNPYLNFGEPVLANPNFLFFYPSTLLLILLPAGFAYTLHYVAHFAIAGVGTYLLARRWGQTCAAAFLAGFFFAFSGPILSLGNFYNHVAAAAWIPWALLLADHALESRSWRPWILLTLVFTLQFLAAEPFTLIATFGLALALAFYKRGSFRSLLCPANRRILIAFILVGGLILALSAMQLLPSLDLLQHSRRGNEGLPFNETTSWSFHPLALFEVVIPDFFGRPLEAPSLWTLVLNCRNTAYFPSVFLGFIPLFFALAGWSLGQDRHRGFAAGAGAVLLLLSFGRFTPFFAAVYLLVPPVALVRFPVKLLVPAVLMVALLAGWGFDALLHSDPASKGRSRRILALLKWLLAGVGALWVAAVVAPSLISGPAGWLLVRTNGMFMRSMAGSLSATQTSEATAFLLTMLRWQLPGLIGFILGGILMIIAWKQGKAWVRHSVIAVPILGMALLVTVNDRANPTVPETFYTYRPPALAAFGDSTQPYRFSYIFRESENPPGTPEVQGFLNLDSIPEAADFSPLAQMAFRDRLVLARGSLLERVEGVSNIDVERSFPPFLYDFWVFALRRISSPDQLDCLLGRANVRYQILPRRRTGSNIREVAAIFNGSPQPNYLYENLCLTPRAYVADTASFSTDGNETLRRMSSAEFDPTREVILAGVSGGAPPVAGDGEPGRVDILERRPGVVRLRAQLPQAGYVVLLDRFDPSWHATLDGHDVPVRRANHLFRAVQVPAGRHEVRFAFRQRGLRLGIILSGAVFGLLVIALLVDPGRLRRG
jgi:hypothetical protein